jgi:hypothetical protein
MDEADRFSMSPTGNGNNINDGLFGCHPSGAFTHTGCLSGSPPSCKITRSGVSARDKAFIVNYHNEIRSLVATGPLPAARMMELVRVLSSMLFCASFLDYSFEPKYVSDRVVDQDDLPHSQIAIPNSCIANTSTNMLFLSGA